MLDKPHSIFMVTFCKQAAQLMQFVKGIAASHTPLAIMFLNTKISHQIIQKPIRNAHG